MSGVKALPREEWNEDDGAVLWWRFPVVEPPYVGSPLEDDFPDYVTHWTRIVVPPAAPVRIVYDEIAVERATQDRQWGGPFHDDAHDISEWFDFIEEHLEKAKQALRSVPNDRTRYRKQMIRVAALAVAAVESFDRKVRP